MRRSSVAKCSDVDTPSVRWTMFHVKHRVAGPAAKLTADREFLMFIANYKNWILRFGRIAGHSSQDAMMFHVKHRYLTTFQKPC